MAADGFDRALARVLRHEGGFVDHPQDPGGATNMGITLATLADWRGRAVSSDEVRALTRQEAGAIYRARYWDAVHADAIPAGLDYCTFDAAVHSGPARAAQWLQKAVGAQIDGRVGPQTLALAARVQARGAIAAMSETRLGFLRRLSTWPHFAGGWRRRVEEVRAHALAMAEEAGEAGARNGMNEKETTVPESKPWYFSRGVWGAVIALAAGASGVLGFPVGEGVRSELSELLPELVAGLGALLALFGRIRADKRIGT